ncbi:MAG: D-TA family PLP-dependent enzyme [Saprospiraceae bacterium]
MYNIDKVDQIDTPALLVFPDLVKHNVDLAVKMCPDVQNLWPHIKTHKTKEVIEICKEVGIQNFKCATIAEAELLGICGAKRVLVAYQLVGIKINRFLALKNKFPTTHFACLIDSLEVIDLYQKSADAFQTTIEVFIDINSGMNRTGIAPENALALANKILETPSLNLLGIHVYDGHIRDSDIDVRTENCHIAFEKISQLKQNLEDTYNHQIELIVGGSPTFPIHAARKNVICSPGTFVFWDYGYQISCPEQKFKPAIWIATRVISIPDEKTICTDLGHKSIAAENTLDKRLHFLHEIDLKVIGQSEEHLILQSEKEHHYKVGDILYALPYHVCPTVALYNDLQVVQNQEITDEVWTVIARSRKISI